MNGKAGILENLLQRSDNRSETIAVHRCENAQFTPVASHIENIVEHHRLAVYMRLSLLRTIDYSCRSTETVHHGILADETGEDVHSHHCRIYR